jgi:membrane protease YdiL (CAAX protease family)
MDENQENHQENEDLETEDQQHEDIPELEPTMPPAQASIYGLIAVFLLYQVGGSVLTLIIFGFDLDNADLNALRLMTAAGQILLILAPALVFTKLVYDDVTTVIRFRAPNRKQVAIFVFGLIILIPLMQSYLYIQNYLFQQLAESSYIINQIKEILDTVDKFIEETYVTLLKPESFVDTTIIIFVVAIVPAMSEEVFFRGFVQKGFELRYHPVLAIVITSAFFAAYHFNPYGTIPLFVLGMYLSFAVYITDSILIAVILHFLNNLTAVVAFFIFGEEDFVNSALSGESLSTHLMSFSMLLVVFVSVIYFIRRYSDSLLKD